MATAAGGGGAAGEINIQCNECRNWSDAVQNKYLKKFISNPLIRNNLALALWLKHENGIIECDTYLNQVWRENLKVLPCKSNQIGSSYGIFF